jgi:FkbM family methyltransferase|tara:strand:- start:210 stop:962 length:753 start_codon:yes stop_codon:yes gene_type:complete
MKNKILKKILGIAGYKLIEKEIIKNERLISSKSYLKIDKLLDTLFKDKKINNIIQIGANDGVRFDILNSYIKKYKTKSILVEPIKENYEKLKKNYEDCNFISFENSAISTNNEISFLYKVNEKYIKNYDDHIPGITSFNKEHLLKHGVKNRHIICENVSSINMKDLIIKHRLNSLDLLYVDAEGYDGKIIIDFLTTTNIKPVIILEFIHIKNIIFESLIKILEENKYKLFTIDENLICYPENDVKYIKFI